MIQATVTLATERTLVAQTLHGDREAFAQLVLVYQDRLFTTIVHVVHSRADAEDIVQEAFLRAYTQLHTFRGDAAFHTWLYRIAMNVAGSRRRRGRVRGAIEHANDVSVNEPRDTRGLPSDRLEREERASQVREAFASLSKEHRTILVLRELEGLDYEQIAEVLGLTPGTVRSRLHRARLGLRERLHGTLCGAA
jgi:RNA polymerase sigma-70 factor, ECF subfamily